MANNSRREPPPVNPSEPPPPQDLDAEVQVLGGCLGEGNAKALTAALAALEPGDFWQPANGHLFAAMKALVSRGEPVNAVTVMAELQARGQLDTATEGYRGSWLEQLATAWGGLTPSLIRSATERVRAKAIQRGLIVAGAEIQNIGYANGDDPAGDLDRAQARLASVVARRQDETPELTDFSTIIANMGRDRWLWEGMLPFGYLSMLLGEKGMGKSAVALHWAACATWQMAWPDGTPPGPHGQPDAMGDGNVLWLDTEAFQYGTADRIVDWGLDPTRIKAPGVKGLDRVQIDDKAFVSWLERAIRHVNAYFVVIDSLSGGMEGNENSSRDVQFLRDIAEVAQSTGAAILILHHYNKEQILPGNKRDLRTPQARARGSTAIIAPCRSVIAVDRPDPESAVKRCQLIVSNLLSEDSYPAPLGYWRPSDDAGMMWTREVPQGNDGGEAQLTPAARFIRAALGEGPQPQADVLAEGARRTIRRKDLEYEIARLCEREGYMGTQMIKLKQLRAV